MNDAGKGDTPRPMVVTRLEYEQKWNEIFGTAPKKVVKKSTKKSTKKTAKKKAAKKKAKKAAKKKKGA